MAVVARSARASIDTSQAFHTQTYAGGILSEAVPAVCPCKVKADGTIGIAGANDRVIGFTARDGLPGEPITLFGQGTRARFGDGLTPDTPLYIGANGALDTTASGAVAAVVITAQDILIVRSV